MRWLFGVIAVLLSSASASAAVTPLRDRLVYTIAGGPDPPGSSGTVRAPASLIGGAATGVPIELSGSPVVADPAGGFFATDSLYRADRGRVLRIDAEGRIRVLIAHPRAPIGDPPGRYRLGSFGVLGRHVFVTEYGPGDRLVYALLEGKRLVPAPEPPGLNLERETYVAEHDQYSDTAYAPEPLSPGRDGSLWIAADNNAFNLAPDGHLTDGKPVIGGYAFRAIAQLGNGLQLGLEEFIDSVSPLNNTLVLLSDDPTRPGAVATLHPAGMVDPVTMARLNDGSIAVTDGCTIDDIRPNRRSARITARSPQCVSTTVPGVGRDDSRDTGDGAEAQDATFSGILGLAALPDGSLLIQEGEVIRMIASPHTRYLALALRHAVIKRGCLTLSYALTHDARVRVAIGQGKNSERLSFTGRGGQHTVILSLNGKRIARSARLSVVARSHQQVTRTEMAST